MSIFRWRLQRLLDVKVKQECAVRMELVALTEKCVATRSRLLLRKTSLKRALGRISRENPKERLARQQIFITYVHVAHEQIQKFETELASMEKARTKKIEEIMKVRKFKKSLEKLREKAKADFLEKQRSDIQKQLDEITITGFTRRYASVP